MLTQDECSSLEQQDAPPEKRLGSLGMFAGSLADLLSPSKLRAKRLQRDDRSISTSTLDAISSSARHEESKEDERDATIERQRHEIEELRARCEALECQLGALTGAPRLYK